MKTLISVAAEQELKDYSSLFDLQRQRSVEANKLWQKDTGEQCNPDLGELLRYFMAQRDLLDKFYWLLREGKYAGDEYTDAMEQYERKDFCRSNTSREARAVASRPECGCSAIHQSKGDQK